MWPSQTMRELVAQAVTPPFPPRLRATIGQGTVWLHPHPLWTMFVEAQRQFVGRSVCSTVLHRGTLQELGGAKEPKKSRIYSSLCLIWFTVGTKRTFSPAGLSTLSSWSPKPETWNWNERESSLKVFSTLRTAVILTGSLLRQ